MSADPDLVRERDTRIAALGPRPPWWRWLSCRRWDRAHARLLAMDVSALAGLVRRHYSEQLVWGIAGRRLPSFATLGKSTGLYTVVKGR